MARQFAEFFRDLDIPHEEATIKLGEVVDAVIETGKKGELTLKIKIAKNGEGSVKLDTDITSKVPEPTIPSSIFFATSGGSLRKDNPNQPKLPLRDVSQPEMKPEASENAG